MFHRTRNLPRRPCVARVPAVSHAFPRFRMRSRGFARFPAVSLAFPRILPSIFCSDDDHASPADSPECNFENVSRTRRFGGKMGASILSII